LDGPFADLRVYDELAKQAETKAMEFIEHTELNGNKKFERLEKPWPEI